MKQKYFMKCCCKYWFYFVAGLVLAYILAAVVVDGNMIIGDAIDIMLSGEKEPECRQGEAGEEIELEYSGVNEEKEQRAAMSDNAEAIALENLTFHYREDKPLLKDFSLYVKEGESVAITGPSGCGKTTISKLLLGLYPMVAGDILLDGHSYRRLTNAAINV